MFGRAAITLGISPHSSFIFISTFLHLCGDPHIAGLGASEAGDRFPGAHGNCDYEVKFIITGSIACSATVFKLLKGRF